jgi:hypothetical protein
MPKRLEFPKSLRQYPEVLAREFYIYRVVGRGIPRTFYKEYEDRRKAGRQIAFRFHDIVMFFAAAAASGVIGNFAYAAIVRAINAVRKPNMEAMGKGDRFEQVVSRATYNRVRREEQPGKRALQNPTSVLEEKLEVEYRLMVNLREDKDSRKAAAIPRKLLRRNEPKKLN